MTSTGTSNRHLKISVSRIAVLIPPQPATCTPKCVPPRLPHLWIDTTTPPTQNQKSFLITAFSSLLTFNPLIYSTHSTSDVYVDCVYFCPYLLPPPFQSIVVFCLNYTILASKLVSSLLPLFSPADIFPRSGQMIFENINRSCYFPA